MIKVIIADDEELSRERIKTFLDDEKEIAVVAECASGKETLEKIRLLKPGLVFLDIQMPGMSGIEVLQNIEPPAPQIIFVTAFDEYAIKAFELNAVDYLLKPFSRERFRKTLSKIKNAQPDELAGKLARLISDLDRKDNFLTRFVVKSSGTFSFIPVEDVNFIEAEGNYIKIKTPSGVYLVRETITKTSEKLNPELFVRIHRSVIVNVRKIKQIQTHFNGEYIIILTDNSKLKSGRNYKAAIENLLTP